MNLYLISQDQRNDYRSYEMYDSAVVAAPNPEAAGQIHPETFDSDDPSEYCWEHYRKSWCDTPDMVTVKLLGTALEGTEAGVVCASFNAA